MSEAHVHFEEAADSLGDHVVKIQDMGKGKVIVHVGLLQINHKYELKFKCPSKLLPKPDIVVDDSDARISSSNCRLLSVDSDGGDDSLITAELMTTKPKLQKDNMHLISSQDNQDHCCLIFQSRVLGKGLGTPLLREGIKSIEALPDLDESEGGSDWQGF